MERQIHGFLYDIIIEPSAGRGSFSNKLNCIAFDINPEHSSIIKQDYLLWNINIDITKNILVIGNPPFGNQSSLAFKFINKSIFANTIAFILPKSFKKQSFQNRFPDYFHLDKEIDLPENSFILTDCEYDVPCVFQIWNKKNNKRIKIKDKQPISFVFCKKTEEPDFSIRRVGVNAGKLFNDHNRSEQSHYFIKCNDKPLFLDKWNNIIWEHNNTAGCNSISKQEIINRIDY
jgi:hypothetical protein